MKKITILIPKIKPPEETDIVTNQLKNIFSKLEKNYQLNLVWLVFQPEKFEEYEFDESLVLDYHKYNDGYDVIKDVQPDLIITEVRLGINGIIFSLVGKFNKIPVITITPTGESEFFSQNFSLKSIFHLFLSDNVLGNTFRKRKPKKFAMLKFSLHRYNFLLKTLKKIDYSFLEIFRFFILYPRIQIFSKTYPALHNITSGNVNICFNEHWKLRLIDSNFPKNSITLSGDPAFDKIYDQIYNKKIQSSNSNKIHVIICPTPMHEHGWMTKNNEHKLILSLIKYLQSLENILVSLKIHPSSSSYSEYENLLKSNRIEIPLFQKENTIDLLKKSNLMITYGSSNVILDAILLHLPVILIKNNQIPLLKRLESSDIITECNNIYDLKNSIGFAINHSLPNEIYEKYIFKQIGIFDGKNSERISDIICKLLHD